MRLVLGFALTSVIILSSSIPSQACCGHKMRCHMHRQACQTTTTAAYAPATMTPAATYGSPQMAAAPTMAAAPAVAAVAPTTGVQPTYSYGASPATGQPAYYYTYDSSGKMVIAQWMDWVFRGGRAAGEPAPPLPIIGALRGR